MDATPALRDVPSHVPPDRVFDFDVSHDPLLKPDVHLGALELSRRAPDIFYTPRYGGHWVVQSHEAIFEITHDADTFSSWRGLRALIPIGVDPPDHEKYRSVLLAAFSPKNVQAMVPIIHRMATELVDKVARQGHCEFVTDVAEPMPVIVFMTILGLPLELMIPLRKLVLTFLEEGDPNKREEIMDEQLVLLDPVIQARIDNPQDDMLSRIAAAKIDGRSPTFDELQRYLLLLTNAGLDTVVNAMSFSVMHLARDPELQAQVRNDPALIPAVIEEFLRRYAPSTIGRRVTRDITYRGVPMREGDILALLIPAANFDVSVYPDPERIIMHRDEPGLTFGAGIHRCLGSHLARLELKVLLGEWLRRIPAFTLDPSKPPTEHAGLVYTVDTLDLRWDPTRLPEHPHG